MILKQNTSLLRIFIFSTISGISYWLVSRYGPIGSLFDYFGDRGWIPFFLFPAISGVAIGLAMVFSVLFCFPDYGKHKKGLLLAGTIGGSVFWILNPLGLFHFVGLFIFALSFGLSGRILGMKLRIMVGMIVGDLLGLIINGLPSDVIFYLRDAEEARKFLSSDLFKFYGLASFILEGYLTNLGLLLGIQYRVKLIYYGAALGFMVMNISTPFSARGHIEVAIGTVVGAGIGYLSDWALKRDNFAETST